MALYARPKLVYLRWYDNLFYPNPDGGPRIQGQHGPICALNPLISNVLYLANHTVDDHTNL
jgi:hypothetical protein